MSQTPPEGAVVAPALRAPVYTFKVPEKSRQYPTDPTSIALRAWSVGQELEALKIKTGRFEYNLLQYVLVMVNGKPVDQADDTIGKWSPKMRVLATDALDHVGMPDQSDRADFLASVAVSPG